MSAYEVNLKACEHARHDADKRYRETIKKIEELLADPLVNASLKKKLREQLKLMESDIRAKTPEHGVMKKPEGA